MIGRTTMAGGVSAPVARLLVPSTEAQSSSFGGENNVHASCSPLRSPSGGADLSSFGASPRFSGTKLALDSPSASSPRRCGSGAVQTRAYTTTREATEERFGLKSRIGEAQTLYDILGISEDACAKEVKSAYRSLARRFHPDVAAEDEREECTENFLKIQSAYSTLSEPQSKTAYDLQLSMQRFQVNGYAARNVTPLSSNWEYSGGSYSAPSSFYSAPSSYYSPTSTYKGRSWETDQCW